MIYRTVRWISLGLAVATAGLLAACGGGKATSGPVSLVTTPVHRKPITVWFDATANWQRLSSREGVAAMMEKCLDAGVDVVVVDVKPISGYVLFDSKIAPRMKEWKGVSQSGDFDLLRVACEEGHRRGLRVFASMNFFAEGHLGAAGVVERHGTVFDRPERREWESVDYVVPKGAAAPQLVPSEEGTRGHAVFVSAANPDVLRYEMGILAEICGYPIDGICLDRVRFSGITADFSAWSRRSFEDYLGRTVERWPDDVFTYRRAEEPGEAKAGETIPDAGERKARGEEAAFTQVHGPLYQQWLMWRAQTVRDVILKARSVVKEIRPTCVFADYTGAWYPEYFNEGVNWASPGYDPARDYDWAPPNYQETAYAHLLDRLYSGWYYTAITEQEAIDAGTQPWASIEGAAHLIDRVVGDVCPVDGGLYLFQYKGNPELFRQCMRRTFDLSDGLMLFDLVYLEEYGWWEEIKSVFPERLEQ